jgi:phage tail-like protein
VSARATMAGSAPDPVGELRYVVKVGSEPVGFFDECTGISVEYDVVAYEEGGQNAFVHKLRGRAKHPNLVLKRGVTHEQTLFRWFADCQESLKLKTITVSLIGPDRQAVRSWAFANAFPVKWTGPNLKGGSNAIATETLEIAHEGFTPQ